MTAAVNRRALLRRGAAVVAAPLLPWQAMLTAQQDGPVYLHYDQAQLDAAYNQDVWAANAQQVRERWATNSSYARANLGEPLHVRYGPAPVETLDIYRADRPDAPIHLFVHGGAWQRGVAHDSAFAAELFVRSGVHFVVPDFAWVQDVDGRLLTLADQVRRAVVWVYRNAAAFGGDRARIYISGHSSGAHLAAVALTTDWTLYGLPPALFRAGLCCSGMFDMKGPRLSSRRAYVRFDDETEQSLSPIRHLRYLHCPLAILYASLDSPEFRRQSRDFAAALEAYGRSTRLIEGERYNHFELIETLANPYGIAGRIALEQLRPA